uniref:Uncharacterized protein n=1 Tax=Romanomermis culicivorax TaxID=13658 RepID=A0A915JDK4_ROMCU
MSYSHSHIDEPAPFEPPINAEVEEDFDELDAVEVHYEEFHEPQEPIKHIAPNTVSYDHNNVKCSFDYETGFSAFVERTVDESDEFEKPCQKAA